MMYDRAFAASVVVLGTELPREILVAKCWSCLTIASAVELEGWIGEGTLERFLGALAERCRYAI
jgi:hypothetical protein